MATMPLVGQTLNLLADGYVGKVIDDELARIVADLDSRGHDGLKRKLTVELTFEKKQNKVEVKAKAQAKLPPQQPFPTLTSLDRKAGGLVFNPDCADNPDQLTFKDAEGE